ncbi:inositol monophosphatase family protein [Alicyclobacillus macrosporangiidus]|uniref:inositol monophosphatase family protein n=1 Tax=Alicyclobacillus macrosporangiidus TaxID=392015 RepID=UPI000A5FF7F3|nr:inositol monophosphatase family protein [Alicyclobacillus macrosporangiidus]
MLSEHLIQCLATAAEAALEAGDYFRSRVDSIQDVKAKSSPNDLVTDVDPACEAMIRRRIAERFPDHDVLGEETTAPGAAASAAAAEQVWNRPHLWIVDPIDGTTNFVHHLPLSVVSVAYAAGGEIQAGVVYDPYHREVFYAARGFGAYLAGAEAMRGWIGAPSAEGLPVGVRLEASRVEHLKRAVVASGFPTRSRTYERTTANTAKLFGRVKSIRALGSAALHLAYVAAGRIDGFFEYDLNAWDVAAGALLVQEAGGCIGEIGGGPYHLRVRDIAAGGNPALVQAMDGAIRGEA